MLAPIKQDPYPAASGGAAAAGGMAGGLPQKPKAPKPKKPVDGTFTPGPAPKKQKTAPPMGSPMGAPMVAGGMGGVHHSPMGGSAAPPRPKPVTPTQNMPLNPFDALAGQNLNAVKKMMADMKAMPDCVPFLVPVDVDAYNIPDYRYIITRPIDLKTISKNMKNYKTVKQWATDIRLIWDNARVYNAESSPFNLQAVNMSNWFENAYAAMKQMLGFPANYDPTPPPRSREWYAQQYNEGLKRYHEIAPPVAPAPVAPVHHQQMQHHNMPMQHHQPMQQVQQPRPQPVQQPRPAPVPHAAAPPARPPQAHPQGPMPSAAQPKQAPKRKADAMTSNPVGYPANPANGLPQMHQAAPVQQQQQATALTPQEMEDLSSRLNNLDMNQIHKVIEILQLSPNANGEYEINITELDARTLRKLQNFVAQELGGMPAAKRPAY